MKVYLSGEELLHLMSLVVKIPMKDNKDNDRLLDKLKEPLLSLVEREEERMSKGTYESWINSEKKKIDVLNEMNDATLKQGTQLKNKD